MPASGYDIFVVGGGVVGSSTAFFLASSPDARGLRIAVVEPDPTYATSSTALSVGGIRQQFSTPENILLSRFGAEFFREASERLATAENQPEIGFVEAGYLFLASQAGSAVLRSNHQQQVSLGAQVHLLDPEELKARFPWLQTDDLMGGALGLRGEGWVDPYALLQAFRKKAISLGVDYLRDRVVDIRVSHHRVDAVGLESGLRIPVGNLLNAAGPRAAEVAALAGIRDLPVRPRKRFVYRFRSRKSLPEAPLTVDPSGVYFRPEGPDFLSGVSPPEEKDPDTLDLDMAYDLFEEVVWPTLAKRVPQFQALKLASSWAGHYAVNLMDRNAVLGPHPTIPNFFFANGFSGHGLQHAPGVGRALSEQILYGDYRTLDLSRFGFHRFASGELVLERNVV